MYFSEEDVQAPSLTLSASLEVFQGDSATEVKEGPSDGAVQSGTQGRGVVLASQASVCEAGHGSEGGDGKRDVAIKWQIGL